MKKAILSALLMLLPMIASAEAVVIDGIYYNLISKTKTAEVTTNPDKYKGDLIIPESVEYEGVTYTVNSIGPASFFACEELTSVSIPDGMTSIGGSAFSSCTSLTSITFPSSIKTVGYDAFGSCVSLSVVHASDLASWCSINFGDLGSNPLYTANHLYVNGEEICDLVVPEGVTSIGSFAFAGCNGLRSVVISDDLTSIGDFAFFSCRDLSTVTIGDNVSSIGKSVFDTCLSLTDISIGKNVKSIGERAFFLCGSLASLNIPNSVVSIGTMAFGGCESIKSINFGNGITSIQNSAFSSCSSLVSIELPNSLETIGNDAFSGCSALKSISIPNSVTYIAAQAFCYCRSLTSIIIPDNITYIANCTFYECSSLTSVTLPKNIWSIDELAFAECKELTDVYCSAIAIPQTAANAFKDSYIDYSTLHVPSRLIEKYKETAPWSGFKEIVALPGDTYLLTYYIDEAEYKVVELAVGDPITPEQPPVFDGFTFCGWSEIPETMPDHDVVVKGSFRRSDASGSCGNNVTYSYSGTTKTLTISGYGDMENYNNYGIPYLPSPWFDYKDDITTVVVEEGVSSIGDESFITSMNISSVSLPNSMVRIGVRAFGACQFTSIDLPNSINNIDDQAFGDCNELKSVNIPESLTRLGKNAFERTHIQSIIIPKGVVEIDEKAFGECWNLTEVTCLARDVPDTHSDAFNQVSGNIVLKVPLRAVNKYKESEPWKYFKEIVGIVGNEYQLTYYVDGEVYQKYSLEEGDPIESETEPTKDGYTFSGWSEIPETMPANDVSVYGSFTVNKYKLVYIIDGQTYKEYEIEYGAYITAETEPTKDGYTFSGWSEIPSTMPAHDVEVIGSFTQIEYEIDNVTYEITDDGTVTVNGCDQKGEVTIEPTVEINGQTYQVTAIADNAFMNNQDITSLTIPAGITTIGNNAFSGCINLFVINIGKDILSIGSKAFANVGSAGVRTRSDEASLVVNCYAESVPQIASDAFENTPIEEGKLLVEDSLLEIYKKTSPWSRFGKIYGFSDPAGINAITTGKGNAFIFDMQGNRLDNVRKGVNIIRTKDGKTKKMMVK